jgi:hypothetical protein
VSYFAAKNYLNKRQLQHIIKNSVELDYCKLLPNYITATSQIQTRGETVGSGITFLLCVERYRKMNWIGKGNTRPWPLPRGQSPETRAPWQPSPAPHELSRSQSTTAPLPTEAMAPHRDTMTIMGSTCNLPQFGERRKEEQDEEQDAHTSKSAQKDPQMHIKCGNQHRRKTPRQIAPRRHHNPLNM